MKERLINGSAVVMTGATGVSGLAKITAAIPSDIGKLACLVCILTSLILVGIKIRKSNYDARIDQLEIKKRKKDLGEEL